MSSYKAIKRWAPFVIITGCYLVIVKIVISSLIQMYKIFSFLPLKQINIGTISEYGFSDILRAVFLKLWYSSPEHVDFGTNVASEFAETFVEVSYGLIIGAFCGLVWLLSTRVDISIKGIKWWTGRVPRWIMLITVLSAIFLQFIVWAQLPVYQNVLPTITAAIEDFENSSLTEYTPNSVSNTILLNRLLLFIPVGCIIALIVFIVKKWKDHKEHLDEVFYEWRYMSGKIDRFFSNQAIEVMPDIILGLDVQTGETVIQTGADRNLNSAICGPIGSGKTSTLIKPMVAQDLDYMVDFINNYEDETDEERKNRVNGVIVIEPSNDLCRDTYQLAKARNIPEEVIYYLDPLNKDTPGINPIRGPIEKAVETFTKIIQGLAENSNEFFKQAQRSHLKHYIYLLKLAKKNDATFDDIMAMYEDARLVADMLEEVEQTIPENWDTIEDRDLRNHWLIVRGIVAWFRERGLLYLTDKSGDPERYPRNHKHRGKQVVIDKQAEFVQGLRNILDDVAKSLLIRRVLFGKSDFDIDTHLKMGGVLCIHTAKGDLADLSNVLGKFGILLVENGIFRRNPNEGDPFHSLIVDEFPDYNYDKFRELPAQSRKYHVNVALAFQSLAQLAIDYGDDYLYTILSTLRHKFVFGDVDPKTADIFSKFFGEESVYETTESESSTSSLMSDPGRRDSVMVKKTEVARLTASDIIHLKEFEAAAKMVVNKRSTPVRILKTKFVPRKEFVDPKKKVNEEKARVWLERRREYMRKMDEQLLQDMGILSEGEVNPIDAYPHKEIEKLEALLKGQPIYLSNEDKKVINSLSDKVLIPMNLTVEGDVPAPVKPKQNAQGTSQQSNQTALYDAPVDQSVPAPQKRNVSLEPIHSTQEDDPLASIYSQVMTGEQEIAAVIGSQNSDTKAENQDLDLFVKEGKIEVHDIVVETKENKPLSSEELFAEISENKKGD